MVETAQPDMDRPVRHRPCPALLSAIARGVALFLGVFTVLNEIGACRQHSLDVNRWWIDLRPLPAWAAAIFLCAAGVLLIAFAVRPHMRAARRIGTLACLVLLCIATLVNSVQVVLLQAHGAIHAGCPLPFSAILSCMLLGMLSAAALPVPARATPKAVAVTAIVCGLIFPCAQLYCFGMTDYRQPADIIVVFGAQAFPDGTPSSALADRVRTACLLYHQGYAPKLLFSGGPSGGDMNEPESMRRLANTLGVPDSAILLDPRGLDTQATVHNSIPIFQRFHLHRVIAVSHFFHLPRIKMTYWRAGWDIATVPVVRPELPAGDIPYQLMRETAAFWYYYWRPLVEVPS